MDGQPTQQQGRNNANYEVHKVGPSMLRVIVEDDAPDVVAKAVFQFFGVDIPIAFIDDTDFKNVIIFVDIAIANMMGKIPVSQWDEFRIQECKRDVVYLGMACPACARVYRNMHSNATEKTFCPECKNLNPPQEVELEDAFKNNIEVIREWDIPTLHDALRTKVYLKMCRGYEGFNFRGITEDKTFVKHETNQPQYIIPGLAAQDKNKGGWKP